MNAADFWQIFLETGAPEAYMLYNSALRMEEGCVSDDSRNCAESHGLQ